MSVGFLCQIFFVNFCYLFIFLQYFVISEFILLSLHNKKSGIAVTGAQKIFYWPDCFASPAEALSLLCVFNIFYFLQIVFIGCKNFSSYESLNPHAFYNFYKIMQIL